MSITSDLSEDGLELTIHIAGRFDFSQHNHFRGCYADLKPQPTVFCIDMKKADYIDSSALGMLLLLRDFAGADESQITIINANETVSELLDVSCFDKLFTIM